ncbi:hypothetical protein LTR17_017444 [Elasticomyces elasticus]|nr:hypothetical protein LTR17_017444 [Elasticomyces elasticus]
MATNQSPHTIHAPPLHIEEQYASRNELNTAADIGCIGRVWDTKVSPLLALPAELRDRVFQFLLVRHGPVGNRRHRLRQRTLPTMSGVENLTLRYYVKAKPRRIFENRTGIRWTKSADEGAIMWASRQIHRETSDVLYKQNKYVFAHPLASQLFCLKVGPHQILLRDVEILKVHPPIGCRNLFSAVHQDWAPRRIGMGGPSTASIAFKSVLDILLPLFGTSVDEERACKHVHGTSSLSKVGRVERILRALDLKSYDDYPYWHNLFPLVTNRSAQTLLQKELKVILSGSSRRIRTCYREQMR